MPSTPGQENWINWAGYVGTGWGYSDVWAYWTEPCLTLEHQNASSAQWVGLGGDTADGGGNLVQSGTEADEKWNGLFYTQYHYAWIEDVPNDPYQVQAPFAPGCGDSIYAEDWQDYNNNGPYEAHMFIQDVTTGHYWSAWNTQAFSNGSTAEWISERPSGSPFYPLANFNSVTFTDCGAVQNWKVTLERV